jgi:hypothetical protein
MQNQASFTSAGRAYMTATATTNLAQRSVTMEQSASTSHYQSKKSKQYSERSTPRPPFRDDSSSGSGGGEV